MIWQRFIDMWTHKLKQKLEAGFGQIPEPLYLDGDMEYIRAYYDFRRERNKDEFLVDEITWNDLDMDRVFRRINAGLSTSGEQYLYYELRSPAVDGTVYDNRKKLIDLMTSFPDLRLKLQVILARTGRSRRADLSKAFDPAEHGIQWLVVYLLLAFLLPVTAVYAAVFRSMPGLLACICAVSFNGWMHEYRRKRCQGDFDTVNYTVSMVFALHRIRKLKNGELDSFLKEAYEHLDRLRSVIRTGGVSMVKDGGLGEFIATVFLLDLIAYEFLKNKLGRCHAGVFAVHEALGRIDAAIAVASYRKSLPCFAVPEIDFSSERLYVSASGMVHPLLHAAVPNDLNTERPVLITGSNASGKSTYLKTAALCALLAQSICTVTAVSWRASAFRIYSSMALRDDLLAGESYYIAETRSLKRILEQIHGPVPLLCAIDEVLRGTNTVERIAASSKILEVIASEGALCLAATHDIELCALLSEQYELYHFEEQVGMREMLFDYKIRHGKAVSRNAINLLKLMGFDEHIVSGAHERANYYTENGVWH